MSAPSGRRVLLRYVKWCALAVPVGILLGAVFLIVFQPNAPKHVRNPALKGPFLPFLNPMLFSEGLTWLWTNPSTNEFRVWLLNVESGKVTGEIRNAEPLALDGRSQQVLCKEIKQPKNRYLQKFDELIEGFTKRARTPKTNEIYWLLNLTNGRAKFIGGTPKPAMPSLTVTSPNFTRAYLLDGHKAADRTDIFLFDLEKLTVAQSQLPGWPLGWWNNTQVLFKLAEGGFGVFDPVSRKKNILFSDAQLSAWLEENGIKAESKKVGTFSVWNGEAYQHYITDTHTKWLGETNFLAKLDENGRPRLLQKDFKFGWSDRLHPDEQRYTYSGRQSGDNSSAVFVRDLRSGTDKMIVPPDGAYFSIPRPYKDSIIFVRSNMLWKCDFSGSNTMRLFPPEE